MVGAHQHQHQSRPRRGGPQSWRKFSGGGDNNKPTSSQPIVAERTIRDQATSSSSSTRPDEDEDCVRWSPDSGAIDRGHSGGHNEPTTCTIALATANWPHLLSPPATTNKPPNQLATNNHDSWPAAPSSGPGLGVGEWSRCIHGRPCAEQQHQLIKTNVIKREANTRDINKPDGRQLVAPHAPQAPSSSSSRTRSEPKEVKNHINNNNNNSSSHPRALATSLLCCCLVLLSFPIPNQVVGGYQLANNLIANNLPPKFITAASGPLATPTTTTTTGGQQPAAGVAGPNPNGGHQSSSSNSEIVVYVKEGPQSIGRLIYTLRGEDPDEDQLTFGVLGSMASELLRIENLPGNQANVYLKRELDRETTESHQVVITLTDGKLGRGNWITKSMLIIVEDVNDNNPVFGPHRTSISLREDSQPPLVIETLEATDADEGRFGQVIYRLDEAHEASPSPSGDSQGQQRGAGAQHQAMFAIETVDGRAVISLVGRLDYEQRQLYQLRVLAIDRAAEQERLSASTSLLISVEDCEDQPPLFTFAPAIARIPEDAPVGAPILRVAAVDGDRGVNNPIKYSLVSVNNQESGHERNLFSIGSDSGLISVAHPLDREQRGGGGGAGGLAGQPANSQPGSYVLQVRASEVLAAGDSEAHGEAAESVVTELTVILTDVNDEPPTFSQAHYHAELLENSPPESLVTFVQAPQTPTHSSSSNSSATSSAASNSMHLDAGSVLARVFDRDLGTNGTFTLHLEGEHAHLFDVWPREATNEASLMLKVAAQHSGAASSSAAAAAARLLDYERTRELRFQVVAREKFGPRWSQARVTVQLRDANDNYPQFDSDLYRVEVPENAHRGMHICAVKATDPDSGPYGQAGLRYTEIRGELANKFKLDPISGIVTLRTNEHGFDRETVQQHHLIVEARDANGLGNRNTTQLLIVLTDVNDQRPKFLLDQYEALIYENEPDFQQPLQVQAVDNDAPASPNSNITYSIVAGDPQQNFTIEPRTGRIRVRSLAGLHGGGGGGGGPKSAPASLGSPAESDIVFEPPGLLDDLGHGHGHSLEQPAGQQVGLDFERIGQRRDETRQFNLTVRATDQGLPEPLYDEAHVIVQVYDKNDHAPVFTRAVYGRSLREDAKEGSQVLQVVAQDGDHSPQHSRITYRLAAGASDKFAVDPETGLISVAPGASLDIDQLVGGQKRTNYLLSVLALDGSYGPSQRSASCLVNITILDVNNKPPEFLTLGGGGATQQLQQPGVPNGGRPSSGSMMATTTTLRPQQLAPLGSAAMAIATTTAASNGLLSSVQVSEDAPFGLIVTRVAAVDLDSSAELRYSINYARSEARNEEMALVDPALVRDVFAIDPLEGTIKVSKPLDRELFDQIKLRLQVEDIAAQTPDQVAHAYLLIKLTDVNDNRPTFKRALYKAVVNENSISGTSVATITADDRDLNKTLRYSLEAGSAELARLVRINPKTGEITVNDKIDRELYPLINVTVRADDFGPPHSLSGTCQLLITVRDENDNNPIFLNSSLHHLARAAGHPSTGLSIIGTSQPGDEPRNHNMQQVAAASNSTATYRLRSLLGPNVVGRSYTAAEPADEHLELADRLESRLGLLAPGATATVREDAPLGHQVAYVRAEDADLGNNARITYLLDGASSGGKFRIDRDSGVISVANPLDREQQRLYALIIEACDNYDLGYSTGESRRAFTQVNIQVLDVNDNPPVISTNLRAHHHHHQHHHQVAASSAPGHSPAAYPSYDEALGSPGPHELPLAECLFISEFQAPNEPILTITASDADDPDTPNGQVDLAIINNMPQNELFALVPAIGDRQSTSTSTTAPPIDLSGFGDSASATESLAGGATLSRQRRSANGNHHHHHQHQQATSRQLASFSASQRGLSVAIRSAPPTTTTTTTTTPEPPTPTSTSGLQPPVAADSPDAQSPLVQHLVLVQSLKERVGNYTVLLRATDRGQPAALSSLKMVNICVQDVNNHAPVFTRPALNHTLRVLENATLGTFVAQVEAEDADHGLNGELQYSLKPTNFQNGLANDWQAFKIDRSTGVITTAAKQFNRQLQRYYTLRVQAQDLGRPTSLSSDIDVNIMIVNSGQYQPEFEQQLQQVQFTENLAPGAEWFTLHQTANLDDDPALINLQLDQPQHQHHQHHRPPASSSAPTSTPTQTSSGGSHWLASPCYFIVDGDDHDQVFQLDRYTHRLTNQRALDRERKANYTLLVQATNSCQRPAARPPTASGPPVGGPKPWPEVGQGAAKPVGVNLSAHWDALLAQDKSLLRVSIKVGDVNDNAPRFTQRVYTGGITTEADFGQVFMLVQATDADAEANAQVAYSLVKPIKRKLSLGDQPAATDSGSNLLRLRRSATSSPAATATATTTTLRPAVLGATTEDTGALLLADTNNASSSSSSSTDSGSNGDTIGDDLFVISAQTGEISLNFDPQKHMKGYFEFEVVARDPDGLQDTARVYIYLLRQDQRVKFVLRLTPQELRQRLNKFRSLLGNITGAIVNVDSYKYYENHDGTVDKKKTSLFLHFVQPDDNTIIEVDKVLTLIDNNIEYLDELYKEFHVLSSEAAQLTLGPAGGGGGGLSGGLSGGLGGGLGGSSTSGSGAALVDPIDQVRTGLLGVSSFLALILILVVALCLQQRTRYERQLKAATVSAFGSAPLRIEPDFHSQTNLPNTNLHSQDPNPIWMNGGYVGMGVGGAGGHGGLVDQVDWLGEAPAGHHHHHHHQQLQNRLHSRGNSTKRSTRHSSSGNNNNNTDEDDQSSNDHESVDMIMSSLVTTSNEDGGAGGNQHQGREKHHGLGYNGATTATPRDSLTSSHGQPSSASTSTSSGSASTTNERQLLCSLAKPGGNHTAAGLNPAPAQAAASAAASGKSGQTSTLAATLNRTHNQLASGGSTFGAMKEVTIYTAAEQAPAYAQSAKQQQQHQFGVKPGYQQQQQQQQSARPAALVGHRPVRFVVPNGADVSQGIIRANQQHLIAAAAASMAGNNQQKGHHGLGLNGKLVGPATNVQSSNQQPQLTSQTYRGQQQQQQQHQPNQTDHTQVQQNFVNTLNKLSILNLETTEL